MAPYTPAPRPPYMPPPPARGEYGPGPEGHGGPPDHYQDPRPGVVARYEDTGRFDVPDYRRWPPQQPPPAYGPPAPPVEAIAGLTRDTWVRMVIWIVPMIFIAGTLYFNLQTSLAQQGAMDTQVRALTERVTGLASDQRVLQEHVQALRLNGDKIQPQLDGLKEQLGELRTDLAAIREKLGIAPRSRDN